MVDILVKLGWSRKSGRQEPRQAVYGYFNRAGRLCYRLDTEELEYPGGCRRRGKPVPIAFKDVECSRRFQGMKQRQVRAEVYRVMETKFGPFTDFGEV